MNLDGLIVRKVVELGTLEPLFEAGVTPDMLYGEGRSGLRFVMDFYRQYGTMPDWDTVTLQVPDLATVGTQHLSNPVDFFVDQVLERHRERLLKEGAKELLDNLEKHQSLAGAKAMAEAIAKVQGVVRDERALEVTDEKSIRRAKEEYEKLAAGKGEPDGLPTPWEILTRHTMGIHAGELWFVVARLKTGKTWLLTLFAKTVWEAGKTVLMVSMEMKPKRVEKRFHALAAKLPWNDFRKGMLNPEVREAYFRFLDGLAGRSKMWIYGSDRVKTSRDIEMLIEEVKPDLVVVDGLYFLKGKGDAGWERLNDAVLELQKVAIRKDVPIVASSQFGRQVGEDDEADAGDVGYAYGIAQAADVLLGIFRSTEDQQQNQMRVKLMESRDAQKLTLLTSWDLTNHDFRVLDVLEGGEDGVITGDVAIPEAERRAAGLDGSQVEY
jgi:replicative DNA helicase